MQLTGRRSAVLLLTVPTVAPVLAGAPHPSGQLGSSPLCCAAVGWDPQPSLIGVRSGPGSGLLSPLRSPAALIATVDGR